MVKDKHIQIRVSEEEKEALVKAAKERGVSVSEFVLQAAEELAEKLGKAAGERYADAVGEKAMADIGEENPRRALEESRQVGESRIGKPKVAYTSRVTHSPTCTCSWCQLRKEKKP